MENRAVIEQAKGIIMGARHCTAAEAFAILTKLAQDTNRKLRDVALGAVKKTALSHSSPGRVGVMLAGRRPSVLWRGGGVAGVRRGGVPVGGQQPGGRAAAGSGPGLAR
ncbi:ANTAR domain-containing protein [Actinoplanes sandaracinus]|uniref:ANTAR domain-containing protein n=1 Tax=Actinoplanes sandaracinus TaxID=3045177 RepID=UPI002E1F68E5